MSEPKRAADPADRIYQEFLAEVASLERFRQRFQAHHPYAPLDQEDPDLRRLIEAMAYFSVQTRNATLANMRSTWRRLFAGFFDFLLAPLPAVTMVQAVPTEKMVEPVTLPRESELRLSAPNAQASFRTERELTVLPLSFEGVQVLPRDDGDQRLVLRFRSHAHRRDAAGVLSFYVRHLDEYTTSLPVFHALRQHLRRASVVYDAQPDADAEGAVCEAGFGHPAFAPDDSVSYENPLQRVRGFFQFPERELFVHVKVAQATSAWRELLLYLDVGPEFEVPREEFLFPFVVPVSNLKAEPAQPITADGTRSEFPILNMSPNRELALHSVTGVFERTKSGQVPLRPGYLPGVGPSFEVDENPGPDLRNRHTLVVRMPEAFQDPRKVVVEGLWHQPGFAARATGRVHISTPSRHIEGLRWQKLGRIEPDQESPLENDIAALTQLLAWKLKPSLSHRELVTVLSHLGSPGSGPFAKVIPLLRDLTVKTAPDSALRGSGTKDIYEASLAPFDDALLPLVVAFLRPLELILDAWNAEATVTLRANVLGMGPLPLPSP